MRLTLDRYLWPGRPRSRANAQLIRDAVATRPIFAKIIVEMTTADFLSSVCASVSGRVGLTIADPPAFVPVALAKIWMYGKPVSDAKTSSALPIQNSTAISMAKPKSPLRITDMIMLHGITVDAFSISSAIVPQVSQVRLQPRLCLPMCVAASMPMKANMPVDKPTKNDTPSVLHPPPFVKVWNTSLAVPCGAR